MSYQELNILLGLLISVPNVVFLCLFRRRRGTAILGWIAFVLRLKASALVLAGGRITYLSYRTRNVPIPISTTDKVWGLSILTMIAVAAVTNMTVYILARYQHQ